jgi:hypothetical protein
MLVAQQCQNSHWNYSIIAIIFQQQALRRFVLAITPQQCTFRRRRTLPNNAVNLRKADSLTKVAIEGTFNGVAHHGMEEPRAYPKSQQGQLPRLS